MTTNLPVPTPALPADLTRVELPSKYLKAIVAILTAAVGVLITAVTDNVVTQLELIGIGIAIVTAFGVYYFPNIEDAKIKAWTKLVIALLGAALQTLNVILTNHGAVTAQDWLLVVLAILGALGVGVVPNVDPEQKALADAAALQTAVQSLPVSVVNVVNAAPEGIASSDSPE